MSLLFKQSARHEVGSGITLAPIRPCITVAWTFSGIRCAGPTCRRTQLLKPPSPILKHGWRESHFLPRQHLALHLQACSCALRSMPPPRAHWKLGKARPGRLEDGNWANALHLARLGGHFFDLCRVSPSRNNQPTARARLERTHLKLEIKHPCV